MAASLETPPLISVVMPVYNVARFLPATLDSVLAQTERRWECILIDDGSKDDSLAVAKTYAERDARFRWQQQENSGPSIARNRGYSLIHPDSQYITFMDSDDMWTPTALADLLAVLEREPHMFAVSGLAEFVNSEGEVSEPGARGEVMRRRMTVTARGLRRLRDDEPTGFASICMGSDQFPPGVILGRRAIYDQVGGFDTSVHGCEDWELLVRLSRRGDMAFLDKIVLLYRRHSTNYGASPFVARETWRVLCMNYHSPENTPEQRQIVRWAWKYAHRQTGRGLGRTAGSLLRSGRIKDGLITLAKAGSAVLRSSRRAPMPAPPAQP